MPVKKINSKSRVNSKVNKNQFKFKWWMALILVVVVGGFGLLVLRFSKAASVALYGGPKCTRVNMTYNVYKTSTTRNVCMLQQPEDSGGNYYDVTINPGRSAKYCIWGRFYSGASQNRLNMALYNGSTLVGMNYVGVASLTGGSEQPVFPADTSVKGYGTAWSVNGGNHKLACATANTPKITRILVDGSSYTPAPGATYSSNLFFLDDITID